MMKKYLVIAHRGFSAAFPENSKRALLEAVRLGADAVEIDLRLTRDGAWVLLHDANLWETFQVKGKVSRFALGELQKLRYPSVRLFDPSVRASNGGKHRGRSDEEGILTLEKAYEIIPQEKGLFLDVKVPEASHWVKAMKTLPRSNTVVCSSSLRFLATVKDEFPEQPLGLTLQTWPGWGLRQARKLKLFSVHPHVSICFPNFVEEAHRLGLKVYVWTVNLSEEIRQMQVMGVDGIFTDFPDRALRIRDGKQVRRSGLFIGSAQECR